MFWCCRKEMVWRFWETVRYHVQENQTLISCWKFLSSPQMDEIQKACFCSLQTDWWKTPHLHFTFFLYTLKVCIKFTWQLDVNIARFEQEGGLARKNLERNWTCLTGSAEFMLAAHLTTMTGRGLTTYRHSDHRSTLNTHTHLCTFHHPSYFLVHYGRNIWHNKPNLFKLYDFKKAVGGKMGTLRVLMKWFCMENCQHVSLNFTPRNTAIMGKKHPANKTINSISLKTFQNWVDVLIT